MTDFGYRARIVSMNSAHRWDEDNPPAPQWRDRIYIVFVRHGLPTPDLEPRPWAYCFDCRTDMQARQTWKDTKLPRRTGEIGKNRDQYVYTCPNTSRRHEFPILEPYILLEPLLPVDDPMVTSTDSPRSPLVAQARMARSWTRSSRRSASCRRPWPDMPSTVVTEWIGGSSAPADTSTTWAICTG